MIAVYGLMKPLIETLLRSLWDRPLCCTKPKMLQKLISTITGSKTIIIHRNDYDKMANLNWKISLIFKRKISLNKGEILNLKW